MAENRYRLRAGYYHNYTGIGKHNEENYTTNEVCDLLNQKDKRIKELEDSINNLLDNESYWENKAKEQITSLKSSNMELEDANARLEERIQELEKEK